jgi:heme-degrading monooxygenase HmoA
MAHLLVHHKVEDYNKFKPVFDAHTSLRSASGSLGGKIFRSANNPNELFVLLEWDSLANAEMFAQSDSIKEAMKNAGVVGMPAIYFVEEAASTSK